MIIITIKCEWTEQEIIDDLLGKLNDLRKSQQLHNHITYCKHCQELHEYWSGILQVVKTADAAPRPILKQRVFNTIDKPYKKFRWQKKQTLAACIGLFLLLAGFYGGRLSVSASPHVKSDAVSSYNQVRTGYLTNQKLAYRVVPVHDHNTNGYVWVNPNTKEIMLFLDGLKPIQGRDYQAWLVSKNEKENAGILHFNQNFAHVIVHNPNIPSVQRIIISIEPQGGSTVQTGPNAINLDLRK